MENSDHLSRCLTTSGLTSSSSSFPFFFISFLGLIRCKILQFCFQAVLHVKSRVLLATFCVQRDIFIRILMNLSNHVYLTNAVQVSKRFSCSLGGSFCSHFWAPKNIPKSQSLIPCSRCNRTSIWALCHEKNS